MKIKFKLVALMGCALLSSCFKEELPNTECDIEKMFLRVKSPGNFFSNLSDSIKDIPFSDSTLVLKVKETADVTALTPRFQITPGATISPMSGSKQDFSRGPVVYTVTSENGVWSRQYRISIIPSGKTMVEEMKFDFEDFALESAKQQYYIWRHVGADGASPFEWATGNAGFGISMGSAPAMEYPSVPDSDGYEGSAIRLTTRSTGPLGSMVGKRIAAGNLFLGAFDSSSALVDAMKATRMGMPFDLKPIQVSGYYQYRPGAEFQDKSGKVIAGKKDQACIYAVFYRNHDEEGNPIVLFGDNVKTSNQIVGMGEVDITQTTTSWTKFEFQLKYTKEVDPEHLKNRGYSLALVFTSSSKGDLFEGAIGSELKVDKVTLISEDSKE